MMVFVFTVAYSRLELCMLDYWSSRQIGLGKLRHSKEITKEAQYGSR
jgi:hypothetical protein